jgi:undecaprenyl-diphosphatase
VKSLALVIALLGPIEDLDHSVQVASQHMRRPIWEAPMRIATDAGQHQVVLAGMLAIAMLDPVAGRATVVRLVAVLVPTNLVVEALKRSVGRIRPDGDRNPSNASFPSSHAANAFAIAAVLARRWKRPSPIVWLLAAVVAWSRVYLNRHFLSDVVCGALIGLIVAWAVQKWGFKDAPLAAETRPAR